VLIGTFAGFTCLAAGRSFAFGYFARFSVFLFNATAKKRTCCNAMYFPGNPDQFTPLTPGGPVVPLVWGFIRRDDLLAWRECFCEHLGAKILHLILRGIHPL